MLGGSDKCGITVVQKRLGALDVKWLLHVESDVSTDMGQAGLWLGWVMLMRWEVEVGDGGLELRDWELGHV